MAKGDEQILCGFCPNPHCQKKLFFPEHEASVECSGCGQRHIQSSLQSLEKVSIQPGLVEAVESLLLWQLKMKKIDADNRKKTLEQETYKINGLSNYLCTILSPLLTTHGMDKNSGKAKLLTEMGKAPVFDCGQLCDRSFLIDPSHLNVNGFGRDRSGSSTYLKDTLDVIKLSNDNEERLVPVHADGDGHCLLHSVSRALVGWELFWHPLRVNLKQHFMHNLGKYKLQFQDFIDESEWQMIIQECDPEFTPSGSEPTGLRNIHVFGLANVLKRPIILLDSIEGIQSPGDYSAIFLPAFSTPAACKNKEGVLNTPLCIAWSSLGRNHFIPLVGVKGRQCPVLSRHMIQRAWGVSDIEIDKYVHFENGLCKVGGEKGLQIGYVQRLVSAMNQVFLEQHSVCASLVADVYQHIFKANGLVFGVNLAALLDKTKSSTEDQELFVCLGCHHLAFSQPVEEDAAWCLPGGELYDLAISCHGNLKDGQSYSFTIHNVIAKYNKETDRLVPVKPAKGSCKPSSCLYCSGVEFRQVKADYTVLYQNGDRTQTKSSICSCGFKHFWNGNEYDTAPKQVLVVMEWGGRTVKEIVPWFQNEQDPSLNSNVYQMAQDLVQKSFPGEFGSERLVQKVVDQILLQTDNPSKIEELKTLVQNHHQDSSSSVGAGAGGTDTSGTSTPKLLSQSPNSSGGGGGGADTDRDVNMEVVGEGSREERMGSGHSQPGSWSPHQPSKAIIIGRQTQSIHKEELNKSNTERQMKQRIEKQAAIQQRKSSEPEKRSPNKEKSSANLAAVTTSHLPHTSPPHKSPSSPPPPVTSAIPATVTVTSSKPVPASMGNKRIRLATSDGRNLTLDLPAQCTFLELQALVSKTVGVPPERQKIRHGFPPVELKAPSESAGESDYRVPIQSGDRIMLDILQVQEQQQQQTQQKKKRETTASTAPVTAQEDRGPFPNLMGPNSPWNSFASSSSSNTDMDEVSDRVLQSLMDPLLGNGGDNLDRSLSALALTAALEQKDLWTYVQRLPHLFSVDGLFYKQVERDMGLEHGKHCTLPLLPHKLFVYNSQDDRLEICLEPYGHFPIANKVETKAQSLLPTSYCRSKKSHAPFSGQGRSLRSVSSQEERMPTDIPMSPKRMEARRLNTMCDPNVHQESIEEEEEEEDEDNSAMKTDTDQSSGGNNTPPVSSHLLRLDELTRQTPGTPLHLPTPDNKLIRKGPGYSELSPIPENSSNEKSEMLHQLVSRIEQAVKSMGQEADKVGGHGANWQSQSSTSVGGNSNNNDNIPLPNNTRVTSPSSSSISNDDFSNSNVNPNFLPSLSFNTTSTKTSVRTDNMSDATASTMSASSSLPLSSSSSSPSSSSLSQMPQIHTSFPSPSAILLSSSINAGGSSRSDSERNSTSSGHSSDNEKEILMTDEEQEAEEGRVLVSSMVSTSSLSQRDENAMEAESCNGGGGRNRVAVYAEEVATSILAMDSMDDNVGEQIGGSSSGCGDDGGGGGVNIDDVIIADGNGGGGRSIDVAGGGDSVALGEGIDEVCDKNTTGEEEEEEMDSSEGIGGCAAASSSS